MGRNLIIAAALSALAMPAIAAPGETPYALGAVHADYQARLERVAEKQGEIGAAARRAADLMQSHNAAQERLILPLLGRAEAAANRLATVAELPEGMRLEAEVTELYSGDLELVTALAELYARADEAADAETADLAERVIWHEMSDVEVLYPAAMLVDAATTRPASGPLQVEHPVPMTGVGDPSGAGASN